MICNSFYINELILIIQELLLALIDIVFWIYNKFGGWSRGIQRNGKLKKGYIERIDIIDNDKKENKDKTEYKGKDNNN